MALCLLATLCGCTPGRPVHLYALPMEQPIQTPTQPDALPVLLVGPVKLASYLDQPRIVRRHGDTRIEAISSQQWAGSLREMIANRLVTELSARWGPTPVFSFPATTLFTQGRRVAVDILRFEGTDGLNAVIEARWSVFDLKDRAMIQSRASLVRIACADSSYESLVTALSQGLAELSDQITTSMMGEIR